VHILWVEGVDDMKIVLLRPPAVFAPLLRRLFHIKKQAV